MSTRRAVLAGASGFIGQRLARELTRDGYQVSLVGRNGPDARWGEPDRIAGLVDGADLLVNLAERFSPSGVSQERVRSRPTTM